MNPYRNLDTAYRHLALRSTPPAWQSELGDLDGIVTAIRHDHPDPTASDTMLRRLLAVGRAEPDALTVALYALAPALRARIGRAVTDEYRADALTDLAFVLLDSALDRPRLAHRLVNRAHNRAYKAAARVTRRGVVRPVTIAPHDPEQLAHLHSSTPDIADTVAAHLDLARFHTAVHQAIAAGELSPTTWAAYRDHRLRRAVDPTAPVCNGVERKLATRAGARLQPLIDTHLHAA